MITELKCPICGEIVKAEAHQTSGILDEHFRTRHTGYPLTKEQLAESRIPIPFRPVRRLVRDDVLYVREETHPHPVEGYAKAYKEYSVIDLRCYRRRYEPVVLGVYIPNPSDTFRLGVGSLPAYQPTTAGDKLVAEMRRLGVCTAWRISKAPEQEMTRDPYR